MNDTHINITDLLLDGPHRKAAPSVHEHCSRVPFLVKGTLNTTPHTNYTDVDVYETIETMAKTYKDHIKFFTFSHLVKRRKPGFELRNEQKSSSGSTQTQEQIDDNKDRSLRRAKQKIRDYALMNDFDKFATFTFDPKKHDAYDFAYTSAKVSKFLNNQSQKYGKFRYVIVSEQMQDGKWHFHALLGGFTGKYRPTNVRGKGTAQRQCYKITSWENNYGFADMEDISDNSRIANYITKYITKDFDTKTKGAKRYWSSKGLKLPTVQYNVKPENFTENYDITAASVYENDHAEIVTLPIKREKDTSTTQKDN